MSKDDEHKLKLEEGTAPHQDEPKPKRGFSSTLKKLGVAALAILLYLILIDAAAF